MPAPHERADEARSLLLQHAARHVAGPLADVAQVTAVVGVERLRVASGIVDPAALRALVESDDELVLEVVGTVADAIGRGEIGWHVDAGTLNADAGAYPVTTDAALLRAAVRAGHASWVEMPYYRVRYGARGARFTTSDSAWLVRLTEASEAVAINQVTWLSTLLATKGMPSWLMERHLLSLDAEVRKAGRPSGPLAAVAAELAGRRSAHADDATLDRADALVAATVAAPPVARAGALLAAAHADVRSQLVASDEPVLSWLTDPGRTSAADAEALRAVRDALGDPEPALGSAP